MKHKSHKKTGSWTPERRESWMKARWPGKPGKVAKNDGLKPIPAIVEASTSALEDLKALPSQEPI